MTDGEAAVQEAANAIGAAVKAALDPITLHVKELEEEVAFSEQVVSELHTQIEKLQKKVLPRDPQQTAALIHEFFYARGLVLAHWKTATTQWRNDLIVLAERLYGTDDAV